MFIAFQPMKIVSYCHGNQNDHCLEYFFRLSLRDERRGFPPATRSMSPGYFHKKQKENGIKITSCLDDSLYTNCIYPRQLEILAIAMQVN